MESVHNVCFLKRSGRIDRAEEGLRRALILSVVGEEGLGCAVEIRDALALKFQLQADTLHLRCAAPNSFLFLPFGASGGAGYSKWTVDLRATFPPSC